MVLALFLFFAATSFEDSFRAGLVALQRNDLRAARSSLEAAVHLQPASGRAWVALSQTYRKLGNNPAAENAARKARAAAPNDTVVSDMLALSYFETAQPLLREQKFGDAIAILEPARKLLPKNAQIELALGVAYYGSRRFGDAAEAFLRTIELAPDTDQPYLFLGKFLDQVPNRLPEIAKRSLEYKQSHSSSADAYLLRARVLEAQAAPPEQAETPLRKAISIDGSNPDAHFELGAVLDRMRRFADAAAEFERAAALNPQSSETHYRLARDYQRLGKQEAARAELDRHAELVAAEDTRK